MFEDVSENFAANNNFELTIKLKTSYPLSQGTVSMKFDPTQLTVYDRYTSPYKLPDDIVNVTDKGEFVLLFSSITTLVDTTNGGTFFTIRGKTNDAFTGDQKIEVNFDTLIGGRFVTEYDPVFQEYNTYIDKNFDYTYTAFSEVLNHELEVEAVLTNLSGAPATSPTQAPTQTDPTESATPAPTTVAPTTVAPTTAAPTTVAPTTVAPTTLAPTTAAPTTVAPTTVAPTTAEPTTQPTTAAPTPSPDGKYQLTVRSAQNMFTPFSKRFEPGEEFAIGIKINTSRPIKGCNLTALFDQTQVSVDSYATTKQMTPFTSKYSGKYNFVAGSAGELINPSGEFIMLRGKCLNEFNTNQEIILDFTYLIVGNLQDPDYEQYFVADGVMLSHDFSVRAYFTEYVEPQPTTAKKIDNLDGNPNSDSAVDYVKNLKNDKDPKGSTFGLLRANSKKVTKNSIKVTWKKLKGAKKYIIMGNKCGNSYKKITTTTKLSFTQKKLRKGTYYKYMILAVNAKNKVIAVSKTLYVATKGGKVGNYKSVKITNAKSTLTLKKGKKMKLKAKAKKADKKVRNHRKIKFESSKPSVVKITAGGKLTAKKKGTAIIYAYAQNGVFKKIKVKVK